jgi:alpha-1,2-mannosyltransferase
MTAIVKPASALLPGQRTRPNARTHSLRGGRGVTPAGFGVGRRLCVLVAALAVAGMRRALRNNQVTYALSLNAAAGLLISPISWSHHWVWAAPALLTCLSTTSPNHRRPPALAGLALLTFAIAPHWLLPSGGSQELHWSWWQQAVGDSYVLIGLATLTRAAITNLPPHPKPPDPGPADRLGAPRDRELRPAPPQTP